VRIYTWILILVLISPNMLLSPSSVKVNLKPQPIIQDKNQEWIAYVGVDKKLYVIHPDGSEKKQVSPGANLKLSFGQLLWSRSGRYLLFTSDYDPSSHLWLWDSKTEEAKPILSTNFSNPVWSPAADILAVFERIPGDRVAYPLYTYNPETLELEKIIDNNGFPEISWLQDGTKIVYQPVSEGNIAECPNLSTWTDPKGIETIDIETKEIDTIVPSKGRPLLLDSTSPDGSIVYFRESPECFSMGMAPGPVTVSVSNQRENWIQSQYKYCESSNDNFFQACSTWLEIRIFDNNFKQILALNQKSQYLENVRFMEFSWSPNNELIAIIQQDQVRRPGEVLSEAVYASQFINIKTGELLSEIPGEVLAWSPDAKNVFIRNQTEPTGYTFFVYNIDGQQITNIDSAPDDLMFYGYPAWQSRTGPDAPINVSIRPAENQNTYDIQWMASDTPDITFEVRYSTSEFNDANWEKATKVPEQDKPVNCEVDGQSGFCLYNINLTELEEGKPSGKSSRKIHVGVRSLDSGGTYSPISNTPWIVDWGFRPQKEGYIYSNSLEGIWKSTPIYPSADFTMEDFRRLYGDESICFSPYSPECLLTFKAEAKYKKYARWLREGRCVGMSITSGKYNRGETDLFEFETTPEGLYTESEGPEQTRRTLAYYHVQQDSNPSVDANLADKRLSLGEKVDKLVTLLEKGQGAIISFRVPDKGWHAVTPIAVDLRTNDQYRIWIYDNNYPGSIRSIQFSLEDNTWKYKWNDKKNLSVRLQSSKDVNVTSLDLFSEHVEYIPEKDNIIQILGRAYLQIIDDAGDKIGYIQDDYLNQIEGAEIISVANSLDSRDEPIYWLPSGSSYTVNIVPVSSELASDSMFSWIGKSFTISISRDTLIQPEQVIVGDEGKELSYSPGQDRPTSLSFSQAEDEFETRLELQQVPFRAGEKIQITYDKKERAYQVRYVGKAEVTGGLTLTLHDGLGEKVIEKESFKFQPGSTLHLQVKDWSEQGIVRLGADQDGDGQVEQWKTESSRAGLLGINWWLVLIGGALMAAGILIVIAGVFLLRKQRIAQRKIS